MRVVHPPPERPTCESAESIKKAKEEVTVERVPRVNIPVRKMAVKYGKTMKPTTDRRASKTTTRRHEER